MDSHVSDGPPWATDLDSELLDPMTNLEPNGDARCKHCDQPALGKIGPYAYLCSQHRDEKAAQGRKPKRKTPAAAKTQEKAIEDTPLVAAARRVDAARAELQAATEELARALNA